MVSYIMQKAEVGGRSTDGIADSNPAVGKHVRLLCLLCVVLVATSATS